jgi:hypothetical protein
MVSPKPKLTDFAKYKKLEFDLKKTGINYVTVSASERYIPSELRTLIFGNIQ